MSDSEVRLLRAELSNPRDSPGRSAETVESQLRDLNSRLIRLEVRLEQKPDRDVVLQNMLAGAVLYTLVLTMAALLALPVP